MRKIAASYIYPITSKPLKQGILILSDEGEVLDIIDTGGNLTESCSLEYYNGIIIPGFVNAHCHIKSGYMKNVMNEVNGLPGFIKSELASRHVIPDNLEEIIKDADAEMRAEGIFAVGDISNDDFSFGVKKNSSVLQYFTGGSNILIVHNIYSSPEDIDFVTAHFKNPYFVLCPNSNLIIEKKLPDVKMLIEKNVQIAIGTDSYSSNRRLSILEELKTLSQYYQGIHLEGLLKWATLNGALALGLENKFGSFEIGKKPGVNLITGIDFETMKLTQDSKVKVLV